MKLRIERPRIERPRLSVHVQARVHLEDNEPYVVLYDPRSRASAQITLDDWHVLQEADGTRDLDALCLAAARLGSDPSQAGLEALFGKLDEKRMLSDGLAPRLRAPPVPRPQRPPPERGLEVLPDFGLVCDGAGACCRFYGSVAFAPVEALRARLHAEESGCRVPAADLFVPASGAQIDSEDEPRAVALVNGACTFLQPDNRCGIHAQRGAAAKPLACQLYPSSFVHDGTAVRVSLAPECACIFASVGRRGGSPLVTPTAETTRDLDPKIAILEVPDPVPLTNTRTGSREALRAWSEEVHDVARQADRDAAAWAWSLADAIERTGRLGPVAVASASLEPARPWLEAMRRRLAAWMTTQQGARGASHLSLRVARWAEDALVSQDALEAPAAPRDEGFYLGALAFGHRLAIEGRPLVHGLRDRATRILTARAMAASNHLASDTAGAHPLAFVEAATRNLGISDYADALSGSARASLV